MEKDISVSKYKPMDNPNFPKNAKEKKNTCFRFRMANAIPRVITGGRYNVKGKLRFERT